MKNLCIVLVCEAWKRGDEEFTDDIIFDFFDRFETPLKSAGVKCSAEQPIGVYNRDHWSRWPIVHDHLANDIFIAKNRKVEGHSYIYRAFVYYSNF